jgi:hypothetical protein
MNGATQQLYTYMGSERVNVEVMFARPDDSDPVITCRLREWSAGRNASRMILAGGRTLDEAVAYAYVGLCDNSWIPLDWKLRAAFVGVVNSVFEKPVLVRPAFRVSDVLSDADEWDVVPVPLTPANGPQDGAQRGPRRKDSKEQG